MEEDRPAPIRFARAHGAGIAYQEFGRGSVPVLVIPPFAQNIELTWERPEFRRFFARLGSFARVVHFDKRGTGASDRTAHMPTNDERVEDAVAVLDAVGWDRAHLLGVSEGGPAAIALAATYPERVDTLALFGSGARIVGDETDEERAQRLSGVAYFRERWGTEQSVTLDVFAPGVSNDAEYRAWEPRYERQSATPTAIGELLEMVEAVDVRPLLGSVHHPTLVFHRLDEHVVPIERAREVVALLPQARLVELAGEDHFAHVGDVDAWLDQYERFVAGTVTPVVEQRIGCPVRIETMGGFRVRVGGDAVPSNAWGSRQARLVCRRLAVAIGRPVPREELSEMLWPDEPDEARRGARLSVVLSNIRRVLGGGLLADRDAVAMDTDAVEVDLIELERALAARDDLAVVRSYGGPVLPEDAYEDWAADVRRHVAVSVASSRHRLAGAAADAQQWDELVEHAVALIELDPYDERGHELLVEGLSRCGRHGEVQRAIDGYRAAMAELGLPAKDLYEG